MNMKIVRIIGYVTTGIGAVATVFGSWVNEKKMECKIAEEVAKYIKKD